MAEIKVVNRSGSQVGTYSIDPAELAPRINKQLLHDVVVMYQSNMRLGTARTKSRAEVAGTTKKMYRQKGTGNARAGSRRSGVRRGGGHIHSKRPRDWYFRLPKKAVRLATRMALAGKLRDSEVVLIDQLSLAAPKTKEMAGIVRTLGLGGRSLLVATAGHDPVVYKSARNIENVEVMPVSGLNALNLLSAHRVLMTPAALDAVRARLKPADAGVNAAKPAAAKAVKKPAAKKAAGN